MAAKWPVLALYDKNKQDDAVAVEIAVEVCVVVDAAGHGPRGQTPNAPFGCARLWTGKGTGSRGRLKILDVAMMQCQGSRTGPARQIRLCRVLDGVC